MPSAADHKSSAFVKLLYMGDSGTGKTTSLTSLVEVGYHLRVLDFDNLLDPLIQMARRKSDNLLNSIHYMTFRDKFRTTPNGPIIDGVPTAYIGSMKAIDLWEDGTVPSSWGPDHILVVDSLTTMSRSAYWWAKGLLGAAQDHLPVKIGAAGQAVGGQVVQLGRTCRLDQGLPNLGG